MRPAIRYSMLTAFGNIFLTKLSFVLSYDNTITGITGDNIPLFNIHNCFPNLVGEIECRGSKKHLSESVSKVSL